MSSTPKHQQPLSCKDYLVSGEVFDLELNPEEDMLLTTPQPSPKELQGYYQSEDYISHTDRKESLFEMVYHLVKRIQLRSKTTRVSRLLPLKGTLLDVGAGTGDFVVRCQQLGWNSKGIEPNTVAQRQGDPKGAHYVESMKNLKDSSIQCITLWHVLEHLHDLEKTTSELHRVLHADGRVVIAVPNFLSWDARRYKTHWAAYDVPRHLWHFSPKSIERIFSAAGFTLEHQFPMYWDAFYISILSEKLKGSKLSFLKGLINGFRSNWHARQTGMYSSVGYVLKKRT